MTLDLRSITCRLNSKPIMKLSGFKTQDGSSLPMILIILALFGGLIFYFSVVRPGQVNEYEIASSIQTELARFREFKNLRLDFSVFDRLDFRNLRIFGESPVRPVPGGKTDLFSQ